MSQTLYYYLQKYGIVYGKTKVLLLLLLLLLLLYWSKLFTKIGY
jgi:hypothetical protein